MGLAPLPGLSDLVLQAAGGGLHAGPFLVLARNCFDSCGLLGGHFLFEGLHRFAGLLLGEQRLAAGGRVAQALDEQVDVDVDPLLLERSADHHAKAVAGLVANRFSSPRRGPRSWA